MTVDFPPNRDAALARLAAFVPHAGRDYAARRNYDLPGHDSVSRLSPYLRNRMISEDEVLSTTLRHHSPAAAEKFIQEVCWRTYWKGVLERRPALWDHYKSEVRAGLNRVQSEAGLRADWEAACKGETDIECFNYWAQELVNTGYLHNHARMWFASIWIFTLRLPWALGADFFLRHLLDGCPASNTLSWRWVGGLQTIGKTYLARPDNIEKYTNGRFRPTGLAPFAAALEGPPLPALGPVPTSDPIEKTGLSGVLITSDDLHPSHILDVTQGPVAIFNGDVPRSPLATASLVNQFVEESCEDAAARMKLTSVDVTDVKSIDEVIEWGTTRGVQQVRTSHLCMGPIKDALFGLKEKLYNHNIALSQIVQAHDQTAWPAATHGFFRFKSVIPKLCKDPRRSSLF